MLKPDIQLPVLTHLNELEDRSTTSQWLGSQQSCLMGSVSNPFPAMCKESMIMTHRWVWLIAGCYGSPLVLKDSMRSMHDVILVGIGTALNDNPQLNSEFYVLNFSCSAENRACSQTIAVSWRCSKGSCPGYSWRKSATSNGLQVVDKL